MLPVPHLPAYQKTVYSIIVIKSNFRDVILLFYIILYLVIIKLPFNCQNYISGSSKKSQK